MPASAKDKIILPLDAADEEGALRLVEAVAGIVCFYKVGLELFTRCGPGIIERVREVGSSGGAPVGIFLDLKLHDIPNTVARAVRAAAALRVDMMTVHLSGGGEMLKAAVAEAPAGTLVLGVSVLTSSDATTLRETGVTDDVETQVMRLAQLGVESGLGGVVASPLEIRALRARFGGALKIVTPGVRPADAAGRTDDQRRVLTPAEAIRAGADYLVIGRPISAHKVPRFAAQEIADQMSAAAGAGA